MPRIAIIIAVIIATLGAAADVAAQLTLTGVAIPGANGYVDASSYPIIRARFRAAERGVPVTVGLQDITVFEKNRYFSCRSVTSDANGIHTVEYATSVFSGSATVTLFAIKDTSVGQLNVGWNNVVLTRGASVNVLDSTFKRVPLFLDFGTVSAGTEILNKLNLNIFASTKTPQGNERGVVVDSLYTKSSNFRIVWRGTYGSKPPPTTLEPGSDYRFDLYCAPSDSAPLSDVLTVVFEGGMRQEIMLLANSPRYVSTPVLQVVYPNGGENFAPCEEVPIRWKGSIPGFYVHAEVSKNNGRSWEFIDSTLDSTIKWKVPNEYSDSVRIRVSQKQGFAGSMWLRGEAVSASRLAFSADGSFVAVAYANGAIREFNVSSGAVTAQFQTPGVSPPSSTIACMTYVGSGRSIALAVDQQVGSAQIHVFSPGSSAPARSADLGLRAPISIGTTVDGATMFVACSTDAVVQVYNSATLVKTSPIVLTSPLSASTFGDGVLHTVGFNGVVSSIDLLSRQVVQSFNTNLNTSGGSAPSRVAVSRTARLIAIAGMSYPARGNEAEEQRTFVFDTQANSLIRTLYRQGANCVGLTFNASETFLTLGFPGQPQIRQYDVVAGIFSGPIIGMPGHPDLLSDILYSPDGSTLASCAVSTTNNVLVRRISAPEEDGSDGVFGIVPVSVPRSPVRFGNQYLGVTVDTLFTTAVCNTGVVPVALSWAAFQNGSWVRLSQPFRADTLQPGECMPLRLTAVAGDTGLLVDTLILGECESSIRIPIEMRVQDRDLITLATSTDMGEICAGDTARRRVTLFRNNDPIPVTVDAVRMLKGLATQFRLILPAERVVQPGAEFSIDLLFVPTRLGADTDHIELYYASQDNVTKRYVVTGFGAGSDVVTSHTTLPFIPEITERTVVLTNRSNNAVTLTSISLPTSAPFVVVTPLPVTIRAQDSIALQIRHTGGEISGADVLALNFTPCATPLSIRLVQYEGAAVLELPTVHADPRGSAQIAIRASLTENVPYKGVRPLEVVFTVNPRLFLASSVTSSVGSATIVSQEITGGLRRIHLRVEGDYQTEGDIAVVTGPAGIAEVDSSLLVFDTTPTLGFGQAVAETYTNGLLVIDLPDPARRILHPAGSLVRGLAPQPARDMLHVDLDCDVACNASLAIMDQHGSTLARYTVEMVAGVNTVPLDVRNVPSGAYALRIQCAANTTTVPVVVVR